jgi:hypothetical protein
MKYFCRFCLYSLLFFVYAASTFAQEQGNPRPDGWSGLIIDVSTPEDAMRILGKPSSDKDQQKLRITLLDKWFAGKKHNLKIFRQLYFKKPRGLVDAQLSFLDGKLVMIEISPNKENDDYVEPDDLAEMFGVKFLPQNWHFRKNLPPLVEFQQTATEHLKDYSEIYDLLAISARSFLIARLDNMTSRPMGLFTRGDVAGARQRNREKKERDAGGTFPGQVSFINIVSRKLENPN